ncbi:Zinc finger protein like [Quillaja saponaria]|uniref:Zinc finger protein like n=1 Tax=Quillaja saponaria TaxID=32244 RepID=A0AAD7KVR4_QUISA|nr:Zinc finger protein like [Quillaja saponaria]KAJ7946683.1 Zinc finger protein like [Quillaja saponaria]
MENVRPSSNTRIPMVRPLIQMNDQLLLGRGFSHQSMSPTFDPYAENLDVGSPLVRYLRTGSPVARKFLLPGETSFTSPTINAGKNSPTIVQQYSSNCLGNSSFGSRGRLSLSPLSPLDNLEITPVVTPPVYATPVKGDEDVLVMDDILVRSVVKARSGRSTSDSSGSSSSSGRSMYKKDICRSWEEAGNCRYGSKCQFAHGKEELRPTRFPIKNKSELNSHKNAQLSKSYTSTGSCPYGPQSRFAQQLKAAAETEAEVTKSQPASPATTELAVQTLATTITVKNWLPQDDNIEVVLPNCSSDEPLSREDFDAYILDILYGPTTKRRLPAFAVVCSE